MQRIVFAVVAAAVMSIVFAGSVNSSLSSFLHPFIGNSSATLAYSNATQGFAIVQVDGNYLAVSLGPYALVTNSVAAYPAFKTMLFRNRSVGFPLVGNLTSGVESLHGTSGPGFVACLKYVGLNASYLAQNSTKGCLSIQTCSNYLANATLGPIMQEGIVNLSRNYNTFESSYASFNALLAKVNQSNYYSYASQLGGYAARIAAVPYALLHNPLFSPPGNFSGSLYKNCPTFPTAGTLQNFPWYCQMIRYCQNVAFNYSAANSVRTIAQQLQSIPDNSSISAAAASAASLAGDYMEAAGQGNLSLFDEFLNGSSTLISESRALGSKVSDATLSSILGQLNSTMAALARSDYANLTVAERTVSGIVSHLRPAYDNLSAQYGSLMNLSASVQSALLTAQLSSPGSPQLQGLESMSSNISSRLATRVSSADFNTIRANLTSLRQSAASLGSPLSMAAFVKAADSWFVWPMLSAMPGQAQSKAAYAPAYAALLSAIIGAIALALLYCVVYRRARPRGEGKDGREGRDGKARPVKRAARAWGALFAAAFVAVAVYVGLTYVFAAQANSALPIQGFTSRLASSSSALVAVDSSMASNAAVKGCVSSLESSLQSGGRLVAYAQEENLSCVSGGSTSECIGQFMGAGIPVVVIGNGTTSYSGFYGYVLYSNASYSSGADCQLAALLR